MFAVARTSLVAFVGCEIARALLFGESSERVDEAEERTARVEVNYASAVDDSLQDRSEVNDEAIRDDGPPGSQSKPHGAGDSLFGDSDEGDNDREPTQNTLDLESWTIKEGVHDLVGACDFICNQAESPESLIHAPQGDVQQVQVPPQVTYNTYTIKYVGTRSVNALSVPASTLQNGRATGLGFQRIYQHTGQQTVPLVLQGPAIRVGVVQTPSSSISVASSSSSSGSSGSSDTSPPTCSRTDLTSRKVEVVKQVIDNLRNRTEWVDFFKNPRVQMVVAALDGWTDFKAFTTLTKILKWYDIFAEKSVTVASDPIHPTKIEGVKLANAINILAENHKDTFLALQETLVNVDQIPAIHQLAQDMGQLASVGMHTSAFALSHIREGWGAVVEEQGNAWVGQITVDKSVKAGSDCHLGDAAHNFAIKCARGLVYQAMVSVATHLAAIVLKRAEICTDFPGSVDVSGAKKPNTGRSILAETISPLTGIANQYVEDCCGIGCDGDANAFKEKVDDFVHKMTEILQDWLSYKYFNHEPYVPDDDVGRRRQRWVLRECQNHITSLSKIIKEKLPAFLDLWYEKTNVPQEIAWAVNADELSTQFDLYLMNTHWSDTFYGYHGLNDIHQELKTSFEQAMAAKFQPTAP